MALSPQICLNHLHQPHIGLLHTPSVQGSNSSSFLPFLALSASLVFLPSHGSGWLFGFLDLVLGLAGCLAFT